MAAYESKQSGTQFDKCQGGGGGGGGLQFDRAVTENCGDISRICDRLSTDFNELTWGFKEASKTKKK